MNLPFLPFAKPVIDEETIAAVVDVLRSGWITSGPKVQAFEAALSAYFGARPVRTGWRSTQARAGGWDNGVSSLRVRPTRAMVRLSGTQWKPR